MQRMSGLRAVWLGLCLVACGQPAAESGTFDTASDPLRATPPRARLSAGFLFSTVLRQDGAASNAGDNYYGQLGDGTTHGAHIVPAQVPGLSGVVSLGMGDTHSLVVRADGTLWSWGLNYNGQLGDGTTTDRSIPGQVPGLSGVLATAGGDGHSLALRSDGTVWSWGFNQSGQLGDGTTSDRSVPGQVLGLSNVVALSACSRNSLAVRSNGTVWSWGDNAFGQVGDGTQANRSVPVQVPGLSGMTAVAVGGEHALALRSDGTVWAWGYNANGQLGDGTTVARQLPVQVTGLSGVVAVAAGDLHSLALRSDGTVWAWGNNDHGQVGDGTLGNHYNLAPVKVLGLSGAVTIAAAGYHSLAMLSDNSVWAWGWNGYGQLGDGTKTDRATPVHIGGYTTSTTRLRHSFSEAPSAPSSSQGVREGQ